MPDRLDEIQQLEQQLAVIQRSTKTLWRGSLPVHEWLRKKSSLYYQWHLFPYAEQVHWASALAAFVIAIIQVGVFLAPFSRPELGQATSATWTESSQADFAAGTTSNTTVTNVDGGEVILTTPTYAKRRPITINNTAGGAVTDALVEISLTSANFDFATTQADGDDIRLFDTDNNTALEYWTESWDVNAQTATVWVKVPSIAAGETRIVYIHYGKADAVNGSSLPFTTTPSTANMNLWLDPSTLNQVDGAQVESWPDNQGMGVYATQLTEGYRPTIQTNELNGHPVIRFDGTDDYVSFNSMSDIRTVFWVYKYNAAAGANYRPMLGHSSAYDFHGDNGQNIWSGYSSGSVLGGVTRLHGTAVNGASTQLPTTFKILSLVTTGNVSADSLARDRSWSDRVLSGDIAELIIYNTALSDSGVAAVEAYLNTKYFTTVTVGDIAANSGTLTSQGFNTSQFSDFTSLVWGSTLPTGTTLKFQLRSADSEGDLAGATWYGPTGTDDYYTTSGTSTNSTHDGDRWVQYRVTLESTVPGSTPTLNFASLSYDTASVTINSNTSYAAGAYTMQNLTVNNGATFTLAGGTTLNVLGDLTLDDAGGVSKIVCQGSNTTAESGGVGCTIIVSGNTVIDANSLIDADGQGYVGVTANAGHGPGAGPQGNAFDGRGASYGGYGGPRCSDTASATYGQATVAAPTELGSAGGADWNDGVGGSGGGAIGLYVNGTLTLNGTITADGGSGTNGAGGGSGGSVYVATGNLTGSGTFTANGGNGSGGCSGVGGGGRMAIYYVTNSSFGGFITSTAAAGGTGQTSGATDGTVGFFDVESLTSYTTSATRSLIVYHDFAYEIDDTTLTMGSITVGGTTGATLSVAGGSTLNLSGTFLVQNNSTVTFAASNRTAQVDSAWVGEGVHLTAANVQIDAGSTLTATSQGYIGGTQGAGVGPGAASGDNNAGGTHAGIGGDASWGDPSLTTYGDELAPIALGSGGGGYDGLGAGTGGDGGGAIRLTVSSTLTVNGALSADGESMNTTRADAGGSGGSMYVLTDTITGSGTISADGGDSTSNRGGAGGGGRVAVYYTTNNGFNLASVTANPGSSTYTGTAGSVVAGAKPTVTLQTPANASYVSGTPTMSMLVDDGDNLTVTARISYVSRVDSDCSAETFAGANTLESTTPSGWNASGSYDTTSGAQTASYTFSTPLADGWYCWRGSAKATTGDFTDYGDWSSARSFAVDGTAPNTVATVYDGVDVVDDTYTATASSFTANWTASADAGSGLTKYQYALGTTVGGTDVTNWTDNALLTSATISDLSLVSGTTYYFSVRVLDVVGNTSVVTTSNGLTIDTAPPTTITNIYDGADQVDDAYSNVTTSWTANWTASTDGGSGLAKYQYALGTTIGGTEVVNWTDNGLATSVVIPDLTLSNGQTYFLSVRGVDNLDNVGVTATSNGLTIDTAPPTTIASVYDGADATDDTYSATTTSFTGNWTASTDAASGLQKYQYAIGTTVGGTETVDWTDNGTNTSVTKTDLTLTNSVTYYLSVRALDNLGNTSAISTSNGLTIDTTPPTTIASVYDGADATDDTYSATTTSFTGNWTASTDAASGLQKYQYALGTTAGGTQIIDWTDNGTATSVTAAGLTLTHSQTYYLSVRALDNLGNTSAVTTSNGLIIDTAAPTTVASVYDGSDATDDTYSATTTSFVGNWTASTDSGSGLQKYQYALGSTAGGTEIVGWTNNGLLTDVTISSLTLANGTTYYLSVRALDNLGNTSAISTSNGLTIDTTPPTTIASVYDGADATDDTYSATTTSFTGNWTASTDAASGLQKYQYALGTTAGGTQTIDWTDNGTSTSITAAGVTLTNGQAYYLSVRALDNLGNTSAISTSNGLTIDTTPPTTIASVYDGADAADDVYTNTTTSFTGNWTASTDAASGLQKYQYALGSTAGGTEVIGWTDNGTATSVTATGLTLTNGQAYYLSVRALDNLGNTGATTSSNGLTIDTTAPTSVATIYDGADITDDDYTATTTSFTGNWTASTDAASGLQKYQYALGTTAGGTQVVDWTDNGTNTSVTISGLSLTNTSTYYLSVRAVDNLGNTSSVTASNGLTIDTTPPTTVASVYDGADATDDTYSAATTSFTGNWTASTDAASGLAKYQYALGTTAGGTQTVDWTDNGTNLSVTKTDLTLTNGLTYYLSVRALDNLGNTSAISTSNGLTIDTTPPTTVLSVYDGADATDDTYSATTTSFTGNWTASTDAASGLQKYQYALGTTAGGTQVADWTDNSTNTSLTISSLSLVNGTTYYLSVRALDNLGNTSAVTTSNGLTIDTTPPTTVLSVYDGADATDDTYSATTTSFTGNWTASTDAASGLQKYQYALGTTSGGSEVVDWTDNSTVTSVTVTSLTLVNGTTYYLSVRALDNLGNTSAVTTSNGLTIDTTAPTTIASVYDGADATDDTYSATTTSFTGNWTASTDAASGLAKYQYALGTSAGAINVVSWTDNGTLTSVTISGLSLLDATTYYLSVRAVDNLGNTSSVTASNGLTIDTTPPTTIASVYDGADATDDTYINSATSLSGNWTASSDSGSGLQKYQYALGSTAGGTEVVGWTDNGTATSVTATGLSLTNGATYYLSIRSLDNLGNTSAVTTSNGVTVDVNAPLTASLTSHSTTSIYNASTIPATVTGVAADDSAGQGLVADSTSYQLRRATDNAYWTGLDWQVSPVYLATTHSATTAGASTNWTGVDALPTWVDGTYTLQVIVNDRAGNQLIGTLVTFTYDATPTAAPTGLTATAGNTSISLAWANPADSDFNHIEIHRALTANFSPSLATRVAVTDYTYEATYVDQAVVNNTNYFYQVRAIDHIDNVSAASGEVSARPDSDKPTTPGKPALVSKTNVIDEVEYSASRSIEVSFTRSVDENSGVKRYLVSIGSSSGTSDILSGGVTTTTSYSHTFTSDGRYYLRIMAEDQLGNTSALSPELALIVDTIAPASPTAALMYDASDRANSVYAVALAFDLSADQSDLLGYVIERNGVDILSDASQLVTDDITINTATSQGTYLVVSQADATERLTVRAIDTAHNVSAPQSFTLADTTTTELTGQVVGATAIVLKATIIGEGQLEISEVTATPSTVVGEQTQALVTWKTTVPSTSQVRYGLSTDYTFETTLDEGLNSYHTAVLAELAPGTTYHYAVTSVDKYGNTVTSADASFTTNEPAEKQSILEQIVQAITTTFSTLYAQLVRAVQGLFS